MKKLDGFTFRFEDLEVFVHFVKPVVVDNDFKYTLTIKSKDKGIDFVEIKEY